VIAPELKEILACPKCHGPLAYPQGVEEIHCLRCRLAYAVRDGIPVMLVDEARPLPPAP
jgi:LSD1 subclass zinc finger protein